MTRIKILFAALFLTFTFFGIEVVSFASYYYYNHTPYYTKPNAINIPVTTSPYTAAEAVFNPYYSFLHRVGRQGGWWTTNNVGFQVLNPSVSSAPICCDYPYSKQKDEIVVGVFGGSVATGLALALQKNPQWAQLFATKPLWKDKKIVVLNFSMPGFKQPQQLITLSYWIAMGQHFDLVLNVDGFNEVVTSFKNWDSGVEPSYPADSLWGEWGRHLDRAASTGRDQSPELHLAAWYKQEQRNWHSKSERCKLASCYWISEFIKKIYSFRIREIENRVLPVEQKISLFPTTLSSNIGKNFNIHEYTASYWQNSSKAMAALSRDNQALYLHVLQPNQWWKTASGEYRPLDQNHIYKWVIPLINDGYPILLKKMNSLKNDGIDTLDVTQVFHNKSLREFYIDDCCHYTDLGNQIIISEIAKRVSIMNANP
jgi:hypothetical protein